MYTWLREQTIRQWGPMILEYYILLYLTHVVQLFIKGVYAGEITVQILTSNNGPAEAY